MAEGTKPTWAAWQSFLRAYKVVRDRLDKALSEAVPLSLTEFDVLHCVKEAGGRLRYIDLSKRVFLSQSRISRQIVSLEEKGYLTREFTTADRRATFAVLTSAGRKLLRDAEEPLRRAWHKHFLHHIPPNELPILTRIMTNLMEKEGHWEYDEDTPLVQPNGRARRP